MPFNENGGVNVMSLYAKFRKWIDVRKWPWIVGGFLLNGVVGGWIWNNALSSISERATLPIRRDQIEVTRQVIDSIHNCDTSILAYSSWLNRAESFNMDLTYYHRANKMMVFDWMHPDGWNAIPLIPIPKCQPSVVQNEERK